MFFIKIKVKGKLINLTENKTDLINTNGIKKSKEISYVNDNIKHKIILDDNKVILLRENEEFSHGMIFEENNNHKSEYYLKESKYSIEFNINTTKLIIDNNKIDITYEILESENIYNYVLEVSDNL